MSHLSFLEKVLFTYPSSGFGRSLGKWVHTESPTLLIADLFSVMLYLEELHLTCFNSIMFAADNVEEPCIS